VLVEQRVWKWAKFYAVTAAELKSEANKYLLSRIPKEKPLRVRADAERLRATMILPGMPASRVNGGAACALKSYDHNGRANEEG
jgi:hypothetical protein